MTSILTLTGISILVPLLALISITPGMCMTLSLTLGINIGFKRTLAMMAGELFGVAVIVACTVLGIASIMLDYPTAFTALKLVGGSYLCFLALQLWLAKGKMKLTLDSNPSFNISTQKLATQGFITAVFNPKGWAFFIALLPAFIDYRFSITLQLIVLLLFILPIEFASLCLYASGGNVIRKYLTKAKHVKTLNRLSGVLMAGVGVWLMMS